MSEATEGAARAVPDAAAEAARAMPVAAAGAERGPSLVALAAGLGSRFGGGSAKQTIGLGPGGESLLEYAAYDARAAGFGRLLCVVRPDTVEAFDRELGARLRRFLPVDYALQRLDDLPEGQRPPPGRRRPWGTGHALWACREQLNGPFGLINADDFYGRGSLMLLGEHLRAGGQAEGRGGLQAATPTDWSLVAFRLRRTLSPHGPVSRGLCQVDGRGRLVGLVERGGIQAGHEGIIRAADGAKPERLAAEAPVSLNLWGFTPAIFEEIARRLPDFLAAAGPEDEFYLPTLVAGALAAGRARVGIAISEEGWLGVTHPQDAGWVRSGLQALVDAGAYPAPLRDEAAR